MSLEKPQQSVESSAAHTKNGRALAIGRIHRLSPQRGVLFALGCKSLNAHTSRKENSRNCHNFYRSRHRLNDRIEPIAPQLQITKLRRVKRLEKPATQQLVLDPEIHKQFVSCPIALPPIEQVQLVQ